MGPFKTWSVVVEFRASDSGVALACGRGGGGRGREVVFYFLFFIFFIGLLKVEPYKALSARRPSPCSHHVRRSGSGPLGFLVGLFPPECILAVFNRDDKYPR